MSTTFNDMNEAQAHMLELIDNLEDKQIDDNQVKELKQKVDELFGESFKDMTLIQSDLKEILISYKSGRLTSDQFERMIISEAERSGFLVAMAEKLNLKLEKLFDMMATIIDAIQCGDEISDTRISSLFLDMNNVMDSVKSISKVITTPSQSVSSSIMKLTLDLQKSDEKYNKEIEQITIIEEKKASLESKSFHEHKENNKEHIENNNKYHQEHGQNTDSGIRMPRMLQKGSPGRMSIRANRSPQRDLEEDTISLASSFRVNVRVEVGCQTFHSGPIQTNSNFERETDRPRTSTPNKKRNKDNNQTHTNSHTHTTLTHTKTSSNEEFDDSPERKQIEVDPAEFSNLKISGAPAMLVFPKFVKESGKRSPTRKNSTTITVSQLEQVAKAAEHNVIIDTNYLEGEMKRIKAIEETVLIKEKTLEERESYVEKKLKKMEKELLKKDREIQRLNSYMKSPVASSRKVFNEEKKDIVIPSPDISTKNVLENYEEEISPSKRKVLTIQGSSLKKGGDSSDVTKDNEIDFMNLSNPPSPIKVEVQNNTEPPIRGGGDLEFQIPALNLVTEEQRGRPQLIDTASMHEPLTPDSQSVSTILGSYKAPLHQFDAPTFKSSDLILIYPPSVKNQTTSTEDIERVLGPLPSKVPNKNEDFNDDIFDDPSRPATGQLPLVSQVGNGLLAVRTYRNIPPRDLKGEVKDSKNPLILLHNEFHDVLSNAFRARLISAAADDNTTKSIELAKTMFASIIPNLEKIDNVCAITLLEGEACDQIIDTLILWLEQKNYNAQKYNEALQSLFKKTGEIQSIKLWTDIQLVEYRSIFEKFNASSIYCLPSLLQNSHEFKFAYKLFLHCQGKSLDMMKRVEVIKARISKYKLSKSQSVEISMIMQERSQLSYVHTASKIEEIIRLENIISQLQDELSFVEADRDELNLEVFRVMQEGDKTPGAFLFFAGLHDQSTIKSFQQLALQLNQIKGFAECNTYMDFATLRKRLLVCISTIPTVEKFIDKYAALYKKWTQKRLESFTDRGMVGGVADEGHVCPMCSCDNRENNILQLPKPKTAKKGNREDVIKKEDERRLRARIAELVLEERVRSASTNLPGIQVSKSTNDLQVPRRSIVIKTPTAGGIVPQTGL